MARKDRPSRVLFVSVGLELSGGISSVSRATYAALREAVGRGQLSCVSLLSLFHGSGLGAPSPGPNLDRQRRYGSLVIRYGKALAMGRYDLLLFDHVGLARMALWTGLFTRRYGVILHGGEVPGFVTADAGEPNSAERRAIKTIRHASVIVAVSERTKRAALSLGGVEEPRVVTPPIDRDKLAAWSSLGQSSTPRQKTALVVGRMWSSERGKGHDDVLAAWRQVRQQVPDATLEIVGDGDDLPRLQALARSHGCEGSVRFRGRVSDVELGRLYRTASVLVMPSRQEGFGLVYAEALWHGTPAIGSTRDAAGEVIDDGSTGFLVPYGDPAATASALARLLGDPDLVERMGEQGRRDASERFTYEAFRAGLLDALGIPAQDGRPT